MTFLAEILTRDLETIVIQGFEAWEVEYGVLKFQFGKDDPKCIAFVIDNLLSWESKPWDGVS